MIHRALLGLALLAVAATGVEAQGVKLKLRATYLGYRAAAFAPDSQHIAACTADATVTMWNLAEKSAKAVVFRGHQDNVNDLAFSPDGKWLATGSNDETVRLWDVASGKSKDKLQIGDSEELNGTYSVYAVAFRPDSKQLATAGRDGAVHLWDVDKGKKLKTLVQKRKINSVAYNPAGEYLATGDIDGNISVWNVLTGKHKASFSHPRNRSVFAVTFSNDGRWLASSGISVYGHLWDATAWKAKGTPFEHGERVQSIAFSPDSQMVATGSEDKSFTLWDVPTLKKLVTIRDQTTHCVTFSPDGKLLATVGVENLGDPHTVRIWDITAAAVAASR